MKNHITPTTETDAEWIVHGLHPFAFFFYK